MTQDVNEIIQSLSPEQREKVEARAAELIAEETNLRELGREQGYPVPKRIPSPRIVKRS